MPVESSNPGDTLKSMVPIPACIGREVPGLGTEVAHFILSQPFFILGTAREGADADCSYRGREPDLAGAWDPLLCVVDERTLVFPDFSGNNMYNSIGNLLCNGAVSLLFVDFECGASVCVSGNAQVEFTVSDEWRQVWSGARSIIRVNIAGVRAMPRRELPRMRYVSHAVGRCL